jgi:hypothetical protein
VDSEKNRIAPRTMGHMRAGAVAGQSSTEWAVQISFRAVRRARRDACSTGMETSRPRAPAGGGPNANAPSEHSVIQSAAGADARCTAGTSPSTERTTVTASGLGGFARNGLVVAPHTMSDGGHLITRGPSKPSPVDTRLANLPQRRSPGWPRAAHSRARR